MNNPKARWDKIRFHVPRKVICLRENGKAGLSAIGALKSFNPAVTHHLENMRAQLRGSRVCPDEAAALKRNARARLQRDRRYTARPYGGLHQVANHPERT